MSVTNRLMSEIVSRQRPVSMPPSATVREACQVMRDRRIGAVVVTDDDNVVVGIFTGRDAVCRMVAEARDPSTTTLADVMTARPDTMPPGKRAIDALRLMQDGGFRHLPVVHNERLVGIVSRGDFRGREQARLDEESGYWEIL